MSALHSVTHSSRAIPPTYLLKQDQSLGTICLLNDDGNVARTLELKLSLASRQAKASKNYSPLFEGVLNLPRPDLKDTKFDANAYKKLCSKITLDWCKKYEELTSHKVLRVDVHLDEGHVDENGHVLLNAHAHVVADRTNALGKVNIVSPKAMRILQTETAKVTGLERGKPSHLKHIDAHTYRALAQKGALETNKKIEVVAKEADKSRNSLNKLFQLSNKDLGTISSLKKQIEELQENYRKAREELKQSGTAKQADYQKLKIEFDKMQSELKQAKMENEKMKTYAEKLQTSVEADAKKVAAELNAKAALIEQLVSDGEKSEVLLKTAEAHRAAAEKLLAEAKVKIGVLENENEWLKGELIEADPSYEALKGPQGADQGLDGAKQEQTLKERLEAWIAGLVKQFLNEPSALVEGKGYAGPVAARMEGAFAQKTGRGGWVVHLCDNPPALGQELAVTFKNGKSTWPGMDAPAPERDTPTPGGR